QAHQSERRSLYRRAKSIVSSILAGSSFAPVWSANRNLSCGHKVATSASASTMPRLWTSDGQLGGSGLRRRRTGLGTDCQGWITAHTEIFESSLAESCGKKVSPHRKRQTARRLEIQFDRLLSNRGLKIGLPLESA